MQMGHRHGCKEASSTNSHFDKIFVIFLFHKHGIIFRDVKSDLLLFWICIVFSDKSENVTGINYARLVCFGMIDCTFDSMLCFHSVYLICCLPKPVSVLLKLQLITAICAFFIRLRPWYG